MISRRALQIACGYVVVDLAVFAIVYLVLEIREMGLYLFLVAVGSPASWLVVPASTPFAERMGWSLGSGEHVWICAVAAAVTNAGLGLAAYLVVCVLRGKRDHVRRPAAG